MFPRVSVIIPVLNRASIVRNALDSVLHQYHKPYELIVVDNGSIDNTFAVVSDWLDKNKNQGIKFKLLTENNKGASFARQTGLYNAEGEFLYFLDSDDVMKPNLLSEVIQKIKNNSETDIVCWRCSIKLLDGKKRIPPFDFKNPVENHLIHSLLRTQGYIIRKSFLERVGGWSKPLPVWNDMELGLRILLQNPKIIGIEKILTEIYSQKESITGMDFSSKEGEWENSLLVMDEVNENSDYPFKNKIYKILNYRKIILAAHYYREGNKKDASKLIDATFKNLTFKEKVWLRFSYLYTLLGFRGAWRIIRSPYLFEVSDLFNIPKNKS